MKHLSRFGMASVLVLAATLSVSGCVTRVVERPGPAATVYVPGPPPEPVVEVQPAPPGPPELWIWKPGHYRWDHGRYVWFRGVWEARPHPHAEWVAPRWEHGPGGWFFIEGHFR